MKNVIIDMIDNLKCVKLSDKGWNIVATILLVLAGIFWGIMSKYGDLAKIVGCIAYVSASILWITKSGWGKYLLNNLFENNNE